MPISWEELSSSPEYLGLDKQNKAYAKAGWFKSTIGPTPEFQDLTEEEKMKVIKGFFADEMQEAKMPDPEEVRKKMMEQSKEDAGVLEQIMPAITRGIDNIGVAVGAVMEAANLPYGTAIKNLYKERGEREEIQKPAYLQEGNVWTNKERLADPVFWTNLIFENAPMMASMMAPGFGALRFGKAAGMTAEATKKLALGGAATGAFVIESGSAYEDAREEMLRMGYDETTATNIARVEGGVVGLVNAMLEVAPFHLLIKNPGAKKGLSRVVRQAFAEGGTEAVQENVNMIVAELGHKPDREFDEWMGRTIESALGGFVLGGGVGAVYGGDGFDPASDIPKKGGDVLGDLEGGAELTPPNIETVKKDAFELGGDLAKYNPTDSELKEAVKKAKDKDPQAMTDDIRREAAARKAEKDGNLALAAQIRRQVRLDVDFAGYAKKWQDEVATEAWESEIQKLKLTPEQRQAEILKYFPEEYGDGARPAHVIQEIDDKQLALELMQLKSAKKLVTNPDSAVKLNARMQQIQKELQEREVARGAVQEIHNSNVAYEEKRRIAERAGMLKEFLQVNLDESVHNGVRWQTIKAEREINSAVADVASITKEDVDRAKAHIKATLKNIGRNVAGMKGEINLEDDGRTGIGKDLVTIGRYIYQQGYNTLEEFAARLKDTLGYAYNTIQNQVEELYNKAKSPGPSGFPALDILKAQAMSNMGGIELDYDSQNILRQVATANSIQGDPVQPEQYEPAWLNPHHKASLARIAPETKLALQKEAARFNATLIGVQDGYGSIPTRYMLHDNETMSSGMLVEDPAEIQNAVIESRENFYKLADEAVQLKKDFDSKGPTISDPHWGDKGSSELFNDLVYHGAQLINSGVKTFKQFRESFVYHYEGVMSDISKFIKRIWDLLKNNLGAVGNLVAQKSASPWYSQLSYFANQKLPGKSSPKEYANILSSWAKKGLISRSELEWSGVVDWLNEKAARHEKAAKNNWAQTDWVIFKQELVDWLDANGVNVEEVEKGGAGFEGRDTRMQELIDRENAGTITEDEAAELDILEREVGSGVEYEDDTKFNRPELLLLGGKNYRELLLTLPVKEKTVWQVWTQTRDPDPFDRASGIRTHLEPATKIYSTYMYKGMAEKVVKRLEKEGTQATLVQSTERIGESYTGTHYDEPNILAHVRFNEREVNGKRVLFLEEIQSDWHQAGRKKGYKDGKFEEAQKNFQEWERKNPSLSASVWREQNPDLVGLTPDDDSVPNAPFKKSWPLLAFKRMVRYAAENGYDSIAWTPGEVQADRYDLSKQVDEITFGVTDQDTGYRISAYKGGERVISKNVQTQGQAEELVGKDLAEKMFSGQSLKDVEIRDQKYSGLDLKVGGEGMIGFYDKIIPAAVNKFFNKPAWGKAKVGVIKIEVKKQQNELLTGDFFAATSYPHARYTYIRRIDNDMMEVQTVRGEVIEVPYSEASDHIGKAQDEQEVWNLPLNDTIRMKSITQGMPLFGAGIPNMPTGGVLPVLNNQRGELNIDFKSIMSPIKNLYNTMYSKKSDTFVPDDFDTTHIDKDRLGFVARYGSSPQWLAKYWPDFKSLFRVEQDRGREKSRALTETLENLKDFFGLKSKEVENFGEMAYGLEGKNVIKDSAPLYFDEQGQIHQNEEHYTKLRQWLDTNAKTTDAVKDAYVRVRRSLDKDLIAVWNWLKAHEDIDANVIDEFRNSIGKIHNYFPHIRYGKYNVTIKNTDGETVYRRHFDAPSKHVADTHAAYILNNDPYLQPILEEEDIAYPEGKMFKAALNEELPEDAFSIPVPVEALEAIMNAAMNKVQEKTNVDSKEKEKLLTAFKDMLPRSVAEVMQARGWGAHLIKRRGIEGFERKNVKRVLFDYKTGLYGWLTKMEASRKFADVMYNVNAEKDPSLWSAMRQFTYDMLRNQDKVDRIANNMRAVFFAKYLGFNMKTAALNLTQNMIAGWPRLSMEVGGSFGKTLAGMNKILVDEITKKAGGKSRLDPFQQKLLFELHGEGDTQSQFINEIRGQLGRNARSFANQTMRLFAAPMAMAERFNRTSIALAAFESIRNGKVKNANTLARFGLELGQKLDMNNAEHYEIAKEFSREIVEDAHFLYGKSNRPEAMRGGAIARGAATAYTFRTFSHNLLQLWNYMLKSKGAGRAAVLRSLAATVTLGGMASIPFYKTFMHVARQVFGEDWDEDIKDLVLDEDQDMLRNLMTYGVPSLAGVNLGGSIGMEVPILDKASFNESLVDQLFQGTAELIGIPAAILQDSADAVSFARGGQFGRAAEKVLPAALAFPIKARRLRQEGMRTRSGGPVNFPDDRGKVTEPYKISGYQRAGQSIGFTPVVNAQLWDTNQKIKDLQIYRNIKQGAFADDVIRGIIDGDKAKILRVQKEIMEYNRKQLEKGNSYAAITKKSFRSALSARSKGMSTPLYLAPLAIELRKKYTGK
jgi:hypothetical protein